MKLIVNGAFCLQMQHFSLLLGSTQRGSHQGVPGKGGKRRKEQVTAAETWVAQGDLPPQCPS